MKQYIVLAKYSDTYVRVSGKVHSNEEDARSEAYGMNSLDSIDLEYQPDAYVLIEKGSIQKYVELH